MIFLYTLSIFVSAFLVFLVQPMVGKIFLPWVGGAPAVWNSCMFFFQLLLLCGYYYAHASLKKLKPTTQTILHIGLMLISALSLPIAFSGATNVSSSPSIWLLQQLFLTTALPFFTVSTTAPLLQKWFFYTSHSKSDNPFFLYAASNAGSICALIAYPFYFERYFDLSQQTNLWSYIFYALIALMFLSALFVKSPQTTIDNELDSKESKIESAQIVNWLVASFLPSAMLLAITQHITNNITPIPLLWVIPLAIYLSTFVIAFAEKTWIKSTSIKSFSPAIILLFVFAYFFQHIANLWIILLINFIVLFFSCLFCHYYLFLTKPNAKKLTDFYLWLSVGGMLGGLFNIIAPYIFVNINEYPVVTLITTAFLYFIFDAKKQQSEEAEQKKNYAPILVGSLLAFFIFEYQTNFYYSALSLINRDYFKAFFLPELSLSYSWQELMCKFIFSIFIIAILKKLKLINSFKYSFFFLVCAFLFVFYSLDMNGTVLHRSRNFFGIKEVSYQPEDNVVHLLQGNTVHGVQSANPKKLNEPLTYFHKNGPLGDIFSLSLANKPDLKVAILGLGAGSTISYGKSGQHFTLYEIDQQIIDIAQNLGAFSFLKNAIASYTVKLGDGRLLISEAEDKEFDIIILDAFSAGFAPPHLLTLEAFDLYLEKLSDDGIIIINLSSKYLYLYPLITRTAQVMQLACVAIADYDFDTSDPDNFMRLVCDYAVLSRNDKNIPCLKNGSKLKWVFPYPDEQVKPWSDNYSTILPYIDIKL